MRLLKCHCRVRVRATVVWNMSEEPTACLAREGKRLAPGSLFESVPTGWNEAANANGP